MTRTISKQDKNVKRNLSGWDKAIAGAKRGIARLRAALAHAEEMKAVGEPWPGSVTRLHVQSASHNSDPATQC